MQDENPMSASGNISQKDFPEFQCIPDQAAFPGFGISESAQIHFENYIAGSLQGYCRSFLKPPQAQFC
jgi:hypothetical protein